VLQRVAACCSVLQRVAVCCSVLQRVAVCCSVVRWVAVEHSHVAHGRMMMVQHAVAALQHAVAAEEYSTCRGGASRGVQCNTLLQRKMLLLQNIVAPEGLSRSLCVADASQIVAVCGRVLYRIAVWYCVLQCVAWRRVAVYCAVLRRVAVCCRVLSCVALRRVAACCSVLQCVAVCGRVLQCVAPCRLRRMPATVRCSVVQRDAGLCSVEQQREDAMCMPATARTDLHVCVYLDVCVCVYPDVCVRVRVCVYLDV